MPEKILTLEKHISYVTQGEVTGKSFFLLKNQSRYDKKVVNNKYETARLFDVVRQHR
jgi:hypothetical protein